MTDTKLIELAERCKIMAGEAGVGGFPETEALLHEAAEAILALTDQLEKAQVIGKIAEESCHCKIVNDEVVALCALHEERETALRDQLATARNDALECAAAKASLEPDFGMKSEYQMGYERGRNEAAVIVRKLKTPAPVPPAKEEK